MTHRDPLDVVDSGARSRLVDSASGGSRLSYSKFRPRRFLSRMAARLAVAPLQASPVNSVAVTLLPGLTGPTSSPETPRKARTRAQKRMSQPVYAPSTDAEAAYDDLNHRLLLARERGEEVPCLGPRSGAWTSDDADEQQHAADRCWDCPALFLCKQYADLADEFIGTWGAETRDPSPRPSNTPDARRHKTRKKPTKGPACTCKCGGFTKGGRYLPGHDMRRLGDLLRYVKAGALTEARALNSLAESPGLQAKLAARLGA